jgi:hypothetical protein
MFLKLGFVRMVGIIGLIPCVFALYRNSRFLPAGVGGVILIPVKGKNLI